MPHLIHDIVAQNNDGTINMVVEIPAGTNDKWQTDLETGALYHQQVDGQPRTIRFLSYPFNYGFIPQTFASKETGGDGDPLDVLLIAPSVPRGSIQPVRIIGGLDLVERGEHDPKLIGLLPHGDFNNVNDLPDLFTYFPGLLEMIRLWFETYKGAASLQFQRYLTQTESLAMVKATHQEWKNIKP